MTRSFSELNSEETALTVLLDFLQSRSQHASHISLYLQRIFQRSTLSCLQDCRLRCALSIICSVDYQLQVKIEFLEIGLFMSLFVPLRIYV